MLTIRIENWSGICFTIHSITAFPIDNAVKICVTKIDLVSEMLKIGQKMSDDWLFSIIRPTLWLQPDCKGYFIATYNHYKDHPVTLLIKYKRYSEKSFETQDLEICLETQICIFLLWIPKIIL